MKLCIKNIRPAEWHGIWRKVSTSSKTRTKLCFTLLLKPRTQKEMIAAPPPTSKTIPKGRRIRGGLRSINAHAEQKGLALRCPTTVATANWVQTNEEAQVYVHDLDLFVTVQILDDTLAVLSPGKLRDEHGYTYERVSSKQPRWNQTREEHFCKTEKFRTNGRSWIIEFIFNIAHHRTHQVHRQLHHQVQLRSEVTSSHQETGR